jgi:predicted transcriptional regulator
MPGVNMFAGSDDRLYTIDGQHIYSIDGTGSIIWNITIPDQYNVTMFNIPYPLKSWGKKWYGLDIAETKDAVFFLVALENPPESYLQGALLAISKDGRLLWTMPFSNSASGNHSGFILGGPREVVASNDSLYVYCWSSEIVFAMDGSIKWQLEGADNPSFMAPAVDEAGDLYVMNIGYSVVGHYPNYERENATIGQALQDNYASTISLANGTILGGNYDTIQAYYANGSPKWHVNISHFGINDTIKTPFSLSIDHQPTYHNGTLYVALPHTVLALDTDGHLKWQKQYHGYYFNRLWFDDRENTYLQFARDISSPGTYFINIAPDGTETEVYQDTVSKLTGLPSYQTFQDGVAYSSEWVTPLQGKVDVNASNATYPFTDISLSYPFPWGRQHDAIIQYLRDKNGTWDFPRRLYDLDSYEVRAYDFKDGERLWNYTIPLERRESTITKENAAGLLLNPGRVAMDNNVSAEDWYPANDIPFGSEGVGSMSSISLLPGANATYVSFWSYCYEVPAIYGRSRIIYSGGVYALDRNGTLLWKKVTDSPVFSMHEANGTIFYGTNSGRLNAVRAEAFAGFFAAFLYIFIRFFLGGTVTRARSLVTKNENRNRVNEFIAANPGSGLYEISRHLGMNKGTARYHLMILSLNYRIVPYRGDDRYVRYFTNSGTYSEEEQMAMALARREGVRKILQVLSGRPETMAGDLARETGLQASAASRYLRELGEKGIVSKKSSPDGRLSYTIENKYRKAVELALESLESSTASP